MKIVQGLAASTRGISARIPPANEINFATVLPPGSRSEKLDRMRAT